MTVPYTVISGNLFHGSSIKILPDQVLINVKPLTAVQPFLEVFSEDDGLSNDCVPSWRWIVHPRYTSQCWAGWGTAVIPVWDGCPWLPGLLHSCPLALQQEVAGGISLLTVGARGCASGGGDFQEQDDFPAMQTAATTRAVHPVYINRLLWAVMHSSNPWMRKGRDGSVCTRSPLCATVLRRTAEQRHNRGDVASWITPVAAQFEKGMEENERTN